MESILVKRDEIFLELFAFFISRTVREKMFLD